MWLIHIHRAPHCKELIAESPFTFMAGNFPAFSTGNQFCDLQAALGFPLLADTGNWNNTTNSFELQRETYSSINKKAASKICSGCPIVG
jgi:hypothetical protein